MNRFPMKIVAASVTCLVAVMGAGSASGVLAQDSGDKTSPPPYAAHANLKNLDGKEVGTVVFREAKSGGLWLDISVESMPVGVHGFHIHQTGSCDDSFKAAGGRYAPYGRKHGVLSEGGPHAGDFPNIKVPDSGLLRVEYFAQDLTLAEGAEGTLFDDDGSAVIVHSGVDDYQSQPSGDAGKRIACGVVKGRIEEAHKR